MSKYSELGSVLLQGKRDHLFTVQQAFSFAFGEEVAEVFDDMISRTIPCYLELQLMVASCAAKFYRDGTAVVDLGCSTGTSLGLMAKRLPSAETLIGVDSSEAMLKKAEVKLDKLDVLSRVQLVPSTLEEYSLPESSFITANYTIQFVDPSKREPVLKKICDAVLPGGAFLLSEKTTPSQPQEHQELVRALHEDFKFQNGYSNSEIARKRESLKGVMHPVDENTVVAQLYNAGFSAVIPVLQGYTFKSWLCTKSASA